MFFVIEIDPASAARALYDRARRQARLNTLLANLGRKANTLLTFEQARSALGIRGQHDLGIRSVAVCAIVGTVGRYNDFDRDFKPVSGYTRERWQRLGEAVIAGEELPPVQLYKLGDAYFVKDGNHRVSVAKQYGLAYLDAMVTEFATASPSNPKNIHALTAAA